MAAYGDRTKGLFSAFGRQADSLPVSFRISERFRTPPAPCFRNPYQRVRPDRVHRVPPLICLRLKVVFGSAGTSYPVSPHTRSAVHNSRWIAAVDRHEKERLVCFDASFVHRFSDREEV